MRNKPSQVCACLDSNVIVSAIAFGGKPLEVMKRALCREFLLVMGPNIVTEVRRNLVGKLGLEREHVDTVLNDLMEVSSVYVPSGNLYVVESEGDNLVLELADIGGCDVLVTGDRRHLLPLTSFRNIVIEPPSKFLIRLDALKNQ